MKTFIHILTASLLTTIAFGSDYRKQTLADAEMQFRSATNSTMYAEAARQLELLVQEDGVRNGQIFYNIGNSWFMAGELGRAVLNYRRAQLYLLNDPDLIHNLETALEMRADLIPEQEPHPLATRFFSWHLNTESSTRWWLFAAGWLIFWGSAYWSRRSARREPRIACTAGGAFTLIFMISLLAEAWASGSSDPGVVTEKEVLARKGDSTMYAPAFLDPLHEGTEFKLLENRREWWHVQLDDGQTCWIPSRSAEQVRID